MGPGATGLIKSLLLVKNHPMDGAVRGHECSWDRGLCGVQVWVMGWGGVPNSWGVKVPAQPGVTSSWLKRQPGCAFSTPSLHLES